jgi:3-deoxy-D-manno-octulosonate 8-phosphate phosphatase (KDO 8-P phosphatase)
LKKIKLLIYDFDGVMTNNKVYIDQNGNEIVQVNRGDGLAISEIKRLGINQIIVSTEINPVVSVRANKLGIPCLQAIDNKEKAVRGYCNENGIELKDVVFVGNDINDADAMSIVGSSFCPSDANQSIKDIATFILSNKGGNGVIREIYDFLLKEVINE